MGFCLFNNVALAAAHAQRQHQLTRVLIIDWDVHHGNGTQDIFYEDPEVLFYSIHRYGQGFYPGTGAAEEK
jgi:acetoin utilization deacetylase AcuC-like enzyme